MQQDTLGISQSGLRTSTDRLSNVEVGSIEKIYLDQLIYHLKYNKRLQKTQQK